MNNVFKKAIISFLNENNVIGLRNNIKHIINNYLQQILDSLMNVLDTYDTKILINNFAVKTNLSKEEQTNYLLSSEELRMTIKKIKIATILQYTLPGVPCIFYGNDDGIQGFDDPLCQKTFSWDNTDQELYTWYKILESNPNKKVFIDGIYREHIAYDNVFGFYRINVNTEIMIVVNKSNSEYCENIFGYDLINYNNALSIKLSPLTGIIMKI